MKSTVDQLYKRGHIQEPRPGQYSDYDTGMIGKMLLSEDPRKRSLGAAIIAQKPDPAYCKMLCMALVKEKKLYSKIAMSKALIAIGHDSVKHLLPLLGKIGTNQHKAIPVERFRKNSYPLPRDIVSRIIGKIGPKALPELEEVLRTGRKDEISEAIDAIGYIAFYNNDYRSLPALLNMLETHDGDELIHWKSIRALQAYTDDAAEEYLNRVMRENSGCALVIEAARSIGQIERRRNTFTGNQFTGVRRGTK